MLTEKSNNTWQIKQDRYNSIRMIKIENTESKEYLTILPDFGARLNDAGLSLDGNVVSILKSIKNFELKTNDTLFNNAKLFPFAGRIADGKYEYSGVEYQLPVNYQDENNACHGFIYNKKFELIETRLCRDYSELEFEYNLSENMPGYPFSFKMNLVYKFSIEKGISVTTTILNTGKNEMLFSDGWHPYFQLPGSVDDLNIEFNIKEKIVLDKRLIPTGDSFTINNGEVQKIPLKGKILDDVLKFSDSDEKHIVDLVLEKENMRLRIWQESGENKYNFLVVYTPISRDSIAIEPMTSNVNAFNNKEGLITLEPGKEWSASFGFYLKQN